MTRNPIRPPGDDLAVRFAEIERRLRALESATPGGFSGDGETTFLRSGRDLEVTGGDIIIDGGQLVAGPTTVDASGVDVGPTTLNSSGLQVGSDVVIDNTGLQVIGGFVTPIWPATSGAGNDNVSITTTRTDFLSVTLNPPNWVQRLVILSAAFLRVSNNSGSTYNMRLGLTNDNGGAAEQRVASIHSVENNQTQTMSIFNREDITLSPSGRSVDVVVDASLNSGSNSDNTISLSILGYGLRTG